MAKTKEEKITIPALDIKTFEIRIVGDTSLIVHKWAEKSKRMMLESMTKKAGKAREIRRPVVDFADSLYWLTQKPNLDGKTDEEAQAILQKVIPQSKFGFPSVAFKAAAINGSFRQGILADKAGGSRLSTTTARGAFFINDEFAVIEGTPIIREDTVRIQKTVDLRYRAEFKTWATNLTIQYNAEAISVEQIINLFNTGGFACGIGENRPEKKGNSFGKFHVE